MIEYLYEVKCYLNSRISYITLNNTNRKSVKNL